VTAGGVGIIIGGIIIGAALCIVGLDVGRLGRSAG
jgi:hypothetical protein